MQRDRRIQEMLLRRVRDGGDFPELRSLPDEVICYNAALLIDGGYVDGEAVRNETGRYAYAECRTLTNTGHDLLEKMERQATGESKPSQQKEYEMTIFISHGSADSAVAECLIRLIRSAFSLRQEEIRCTSVDGYRLEAGAPTDERLKQEVRGSRAFIGIITPTSIKSAYVLFELGARWGAGLSLFPVLASGADSSTLRGPLSGINGLSLVNEAQIHQLLADLGKVLGRQPASPSGYTKDIKSLVDVAKISSPFTDNDRNSAERSKPRGSRDIRSLYEIDPRTGWAVEKASGKLFCNKCLLREPPIESPLIDRDGDGGWRCEAPDCYAYLPSLPKAEMDHQRSAARAEKSRRRNDGLRGLL